MRTLTGTETDPARQMSNRFDYYGDEENTYYGKVPYKYTFRSIEIYQTSAGIIPSQTITLREYREIHNENFKYG